MFSTNSKFSSLVRINNIYKYSVDTTYKTYFGTSTKWHLYPIEYQRWSGKKT